MIEAEAIDAASTIKLLEALEALYPASALIHVFLDNARYHHAKVVQEWLSQPSEGSPYISSRRVARIFYAAAAVLMIRRLAPCS